MDSERAQKSAQKSRVSVVNHLLAGTEGKALARAALDGLVSHGLTPTPHAYEVWLCHESGANPPLTLALNNLIAEPGALTDESLEALYVTYFSEMNYADEVMKTGDRFANELINVARTLKTAGAGAKEFGDRLTGARGAMLEGASPENVRNIVDTLVSATVEMEQHSLALEKRLTDSTREVTSLREALQTVRAEAFTDALTAVANRKMFDTTLASVFAEDVPAGKPVSLVMGDIDFFKRINDTWGHSTGDQVIRFVANALKAKAWTQHLVARVGGEEFAVIMPDTTLRDAAAIAEQVRLAVASKRLIRRSTNEDLGQITMSFGVAAVQPGDTERSLMERADESLYASKRTGRNKVTTDEADETVESAAA